MLNNERSVMNKLGLAEIIADYSTIWLCDKYITSLVGISLFHPFTVIIGGSLHPEFILCLS